MQGFQALSDGDEAFQQAGVSHADALQKMRIMALLQLAARQRDLDFRTIQVITILPGPSHCVYSSCHITSFRDLGWADDNV